MPFKPIPDVAFLRSRYAYDPATGVLTSKFGRWAGRPIMHTEAQGYVTVRIHGAHFKAHRVIWKMMTGLEPPEEIDHRNRDRADNRWGNLVDATKTENQWNRTVQHQSRSRLIGAFWCEREQCWSSDIRINGRKHWLGYFATPEEAHAAYTAAAKALR